MKTLDLSDQCIRQSFPTVASRRRTATSSLQFSPKHFGQLCQALERPELAEDKRFSTLPDRRENGEILEEIISEVIRSKTVVEWERQLEDFDVPYPILSISEALSHPHARARDMVDG